METRKLLLKIAKKYPKKLKESFDHVGHMIGPIPKNTTKILLLLDLDWESLPKVKEIKPDIIITHHPFIFGTKAKVFKHDLSKFKLAKEIEDMNIAVFSYHTNFDIAKDGMNDALSSALGLENIYTPEKEPMMRIGYLYSPLPIEEFCKKVKKDLDMNYGLLVNYGNNNILKVGIIGGGGSRRWNIAQEEGCDIYISGDAPHYVRRDIVNNNFNYLDLPHEVEKIFMKKMKEVLLNIDDSLQIYCYDHEKLPVVI